MLFNECENLHNLFFSENKRNYLKLSLIKSSNNLTSSNALKGLLKEELLFVLSEQALINDFKSGPENTGIDSEAGEIKCIPLIPCRIILLLFRAKMISLGY